jgi:WD40 repeat protein
MRTNSPVFRQMIHKGSVNALKLIKNKNYFSTCSADGTIRILNLPDFETVL